MKLCRYTSDRFAGTSGVNVSFHDGMNVVLGENESGKTTMIEGIFRVLETPANIDKRSDKEFLNNFFPTDGGNVIDATLAFSDDGKEYELSKTWVSDKEGRHEVSLREKTSGKKMVDKGAENWLAEVLKYGEGIYSNVIFGRQNNEAEVLKWLYSFLKNDTENGREEAKRIISEALSAAGGISLDKLSNLLDSEISSRAAKWDFDKDVPEKRGLKRGTGSIYQKHEEYTEAVKNVKSAQADSLAAEECRTKIRENKARALELKKETDEYNLKKSAVETRAARLEIAQKEAKQYENNQSILKKWSEMQKALDEAKPLLAMQTKLENKKKYDSLKEQVELAKKILSELKADEGFVAPFEKLPEDLKAAAAWEKKISQNKLTLSAGTLQARVEMTAPNIAELTHAEGSVKVSDTAQIDAKGFVSVQIPGIAQIIVSPENVDVAKIQEEIKDGEEQLRKILTGYAAGSVEELEAKKTDYDMKKQRIHMNREKLENKLGGRELSELETELAGMAASGFADTGTSDALALEDFEQRKMAVMERIGEKSLGECVSKCELQIQAYAGQYQSISALQVETEKYKDARERLDGLLADGEISPEELGKNIDALNAEAENIQNETGELQRKLGGLESREIDDISGLEEKAEAAEAALEKEKRECLLYKKIKNDLVALRESAGNGFQGFYDRFNGYLSEISDGRLKVSEGTDFESGVNRLSVSALLSEGTKKTVALAFRLAVLDFFFPDGGGFVVLDDALIDMDPGRRERSAKLLGKFAEKNQVILTTCDPSVAGLFGQNVIKL